MIKDLLVAGTDFPGAAQTTRANQSSSILGGDSVQINIARAISAGSANVLVAIHPQNTRTHSFQQLIFC
jgi:hypothetical protein